MPTKLACYLDVKWTEKHPNRGSIMFLITLSALLLVGALFAVIVHPPNSRDVENNPAAFIAP